MFKKFLYIFLLFASIAQGSWFFSNKSTHDDWKDAQQNISQTIILLAGHECDQVSGAGQDIKYQGAMHSIEAILNMRMIPILKKELLKLGFSIITDSCHDPDEQQDTRSKLHTFIGNLEEEKQAYALELHFDTAWGKSGIIPGSKYQDTGKYIHPFDEALADEFGYFSMFHRGPNPRENKPKATGLTAVKNGISLLELAPLTKQLEKQVTQENEKNRFTKTDRYLKKLALRIAKTLKPFA